MTWQEDFTVIFCVLVIFIFGVLIGYYAPHPIEKVIVTNTINKTIYINQTVNQTCQMNASYVNSLVIAGGGGKPEPTPEPTVEPTPEPTYEPDPDPAPDPTPIPTRTVLPVSEFPFLKKLLNMVNHDGN
jgi:outer membrane biosynthesis protein TonB